MSIVLENFTHRAIILPRRGGKIASFYEKTGGFELLEQPKNGYPSLEPGMPFHQGDASGFDDVFPSMGNETVDGKAMPDHGMIWTMPMNGVQNGNSVTLEGSCDWFRYCKTVSLHEDTLDVNIKIRNESPDSRRCCWVCHCLMRLEQDIRFLFPEESRQLLLLSPVGAHQAGEMLDRINCDYDFSGLPEPGKAFKFYFTDPVQSGKCTVVYPGSHMYAEMRFDTEVLKYLGFWITTGLYRGDRNFAFEPATGFFDTIGTAGKNGSVTWIEPGKSLSFHLSLSLKRGEMKP